MGLIVAGSFNWAAFARRSLGSFKESKTNVVTMLAARLVVKADGKKRFIIALKYEGETDLSTMAYTVYETH